MYGTRLRRAYQKEEMVLFSLPHDVRTKHPKFEYYDYVELRYDFCFLRSALRCAALRCVT
ncbi:hypothetical protein HBH56_239900 [Parastagonospora nodorum]|uniref:Uncharacterized protein n=1 Tax=Phaeosphaeria nodorum (strain SN15 / ATCC MYA-4574 / FGSC 10173) TaxID=321614 RepID=A0A7U2EWE0_PHANO|nr:hypothetical protein HBH56_239900 [Parastagonospora nodorum]QRC93123.1 hypothetical protein JI435_403390 [Parastagonospora nodorum SN15]KAH3932406.1 hypothetical protein HBH54_084530 [Parastagonospora nodorum]KAH3954766.1 hypothetical protein HBH53_009860 [Parastagonospora nodorum]KAH3988399.1 hypothetical protein HBH51_007960 [Parastagonospora nodorum]